MQITETEYLGTCIKVTMFVSNHEYDLLASNILSHKNRVVDNKKEIAKKKLKEKECKIYDLSIKDDESYLADFLIDHVIEDYENISEFIVAYRSDIEDSKGRSILKWRFFNNGDENRGMISLEGLSNYLKRKIENLTDALEQG